LRPGALRLDHEVESETVVSYIIIGLSMLLKRAVCQYVGYIYQKSLKLAGIYLVFGRLKFCEDRTLHTIYPADLFLGYDTRTILEDETGRITIRVFMIFKVGVNLED
jgi:hypothetical protein